MKIIAVIPARYAASRFPAKLMGMLGKKTVIRSTYENALKTQLFSDVFVVTDSEIIHNDITRNGGKAIMSSREHETGSDRIAEAVENLECDIIINIQGDEPFVKIEPLAKLIEVFKKDQKNEIDVATLIRKIDDWKLIEDPNYVKVVKDRNDFALYFSRSVIPYPREKSFLADYYEHVGVYAFRRKALLDFAKLPMLQNEQAEKVECIRYLEHGMKIKVIETDFVGVEIDTPEDLEKANEILKEQINEKI
ncbi:3-deoxy-manno-octulosonate cytidylyltransferase (CMP-KDO synthetase) [Apibacter mensalis]|uniref:3-deoxy-manno-octulosonate cytidylyltransferase n=1 Tax=Apibacter mensalis TaxID=1586267 RepID=A0A0X3ANX5_9FLAO|nr:3-deoxy-manno-octulosonate cytidylyltransferase [Apibacter mensalis]CVK15857.1 3-deoxy-manno-octulosonate cytidylyltransferase (CMP-KDO synthetase) [Apibacter mensalis]